MTLGIEPDRPATDYGYIRCGEPIHEAPGAARVARFVEKPDRAGAEALITDGALWNSGYFLFRADLMLAELEAFVPDVLAAARALESLPDPVPWGIAQVPGRAVFLAAMAAQMPSEAQAAAAMLVNDLATLGRDLPRAALEAAAGLRVLRSA